MSGRKCRTRNGCRIRWQAVQGRQGVHVTGRQAAQAAVAQSRLLLLLQEFGQLLSQARQRLLHRLPDPEIDEAVTQVWSGQELGGQVCDGLGRISFGNRRQGRYITLHHAVAHGVGEGHVPVVARRVLWQFSLKAVQILDQRRRDRIHPKSGANARGINGFRVETRASLRSPDSMRPPQLRGRGRHQGRTASCRCD